MDQLIPVLISVVVGFIAGAVVSRNNAKDTTAIIAAVNSAKDSLVSHTTALVPLASVAPVVVKPVA